jgi:hypothetical protein
MGAHVWAPVDDETTMNYSVDFDPAQPFAPDEPKRSKAWLGIHTENFPGTDRAIQNKANDYLIDRAAQKKGGSFTGIRGLGVQDCGIQESMGPIAERTIEHLGISDTIIIKLRRFLLDALATMEAGGRLPGLDPAAYRVRSARFKLPKGRDYTEAVDDFVRIRELAAAK